MKRVDLPELRQIRAYVGERFGVAAMTRGYMNVCAEMRLESQSQLSRVRLLPASKSKVS